MSKPEWKTRIYEDLWVTVRTRTTGKSYMDYEAYEHYGWDSNNHPLYIKKQDGPGALVETETLDDAQPIMTGHIRFDGCSHNHFGESGYIHGCSLQDIVKLSEVFKRLWEIALEEVENMKEFAR